MSLTARELYDRFQASKHGKLGLGDILPQLKDEPEAVKVGWDAVAWLANGSKAESPATKPVEPHSNVTVMGSHLPAGATVHPKTGEVKK
jgi:hypothetical protein